MLPSERLALALRATWDAIPYLLHGSPEIVDRKFELIRREHEARNRRICERLAAASSEATRESPLRDSEPTSWTAT
jgi:hypothetical protein